MMGVCKSDWKPRTIARAAVEKGKTTGTHEDWLRTRDVILKVVRRFPEVIGAVRDALDAARRPCPEELAT
jgi:hypothetical protein